MGVILFNEVSSLESIVFDEEEEDEDAWVGCEVALDDISPLNIDRNIVECGLYSLLSYE